jgi:hypothetical protein
VRDGRSVRWVPLRPGERFVRSGFTRSDARLARWERPLERGTVFSRMERGGKREWREWTSTQRDRQTVQVRERGVRPSGEAVRRPGPGREERSTVRPPTERPRTDRQERVQPRSQDRPDRRLPQRDLGGGEDRSVQKGVAPSPRRPETPAGNIAPDRGIPRPEKSETGRPTYRNPSVERDFERGGGGDWSNFGGRGGERATGGGRR